MVFPAAIRQTAPVVAGGKLSLNRKMTRYLQVPFQPLGFPSHVHFHGSTRNTFSSI